MAPEDQFEIHDGGRGCGVSDRGLRNLNEYLDEMTNEYYQKNREKILADRKIRYQIKKDELNAKSREDRKLNLEVYRLDGRVRYEIHREKILTNKKIRYYIKKKELAELKNEKQ